MDFLDAVPQAKRNRINHVLKCMETQLGFTVLFASETGSRAWGTYSRDSDYDVRAVVVFGDDHYNRRLLQNNCKSRPSIHKIHCPDEVSVEFSEKKGTMIAFIDGPDMKREIDICIWDVTKTIAKACEGNSAVSRWFASPIVYINRPSFSEAIRRLMCPDNMWHTLIHHNLGMAKTNVRALVTKHIRSDISSRSHDALCDLNKACQALRSDTNAARSKEQDVSLVSSDRAKRAFHAFLLSTTMDMPATLPVDQMEKWDAKKILYVFLPCMRLAWMMQRSSPDGIPPVWFPECMRQTDVPKSVEEGITALLNMKRSGKEHDMVEPNKELWRWIEETMAKAESYKTNQQQVPIPVQVQSSIFALARSITQPGRGHSSPEGRRP